MTLKSPVLSMNSVTVEYRRKLQDPVQAVAGVSVEVNPGEIVGLVGESGCGKSTLAKAAVGILAPKEGEILLEGSRVQPLNQRVRVKGQRRLQMVFQDPQSSLNPRRTVESQIRDGLALATDLPRSEYARRVSELLVQVGLPLSAASSHPHQFSGGQRQRICIARALAANPSVLVADEPISALDASAQAQIANLLVDLTAELQIGLLFISHDLSIVREIADRVYVMYLGKIVESGSPTELWARPLHPYTRALVSAVPTVERGHLPEALDGDVPDPASPPSGCRFHNRCRFAMDRCSADEPELIEIVPGSRSACWLNEPGKPVLHLLGPDTATLKIKEE